MVKIPTCEVNILDLFLTNQPGKVHATKTLPSLGSSDHDIVFHEIYRVTNEALLTEAT